jgi:hypothetical protein
MEEQLFITIVLFYVSLYKNISPTFVYDAEGNLVAGTIFIKTNIGAGCQGKTDQGLKFRRAMHAMSVYIGPGLPNSTAATQEMDGLYETYKNMCDTAAQDVFTRKTHAQGLVVEKFKQALKDGLVKDTGRTIKPAQLDNYAIPEIVNGKPGFVLKKRPWEYCFTFSKITRSWL